MPTSLPVPSVTVGQTFTDTMWGSYIRDNINKLLNQGHRVLTVAQFAALSSPEGTKGTVAPDEVYLEVDSANGIQWHLAYESGEPTYKWRFLGGPPMVSRIDTAESTASTTYVDLTTAGPAITLPRNGDYDLTFGCANNPAGNVGAMSMNQGGGPTDTLGVQAGVLASVSRELRITGITAATVTAKYRMNTAVAGTYSNRFLAVRPARLI